MESVYSSYQVMLLWSYEVGKRLSSYGLVSKKHQLMEMKSLTQKVNSPCFITKSFNFLFQQDNIKSLNEGEI